MLTKADIKLINALSKRKGRQEYNLFVCEGHKIIREMIGAFTCKLLVAEAGQYALLRDELEQLPSAYRPQRIELVDAGFDFKKISSMTSPQPILALFEIPEESDECSASSEDITLLLDDVQDPGNVGTIIRTADWFGVRIVYLTAGCADPYSSKVIQATMGALGRVQVKRLRDLTALQALYAGAIYGTFLEGENIYETDLTNRPALLVLGNEGNGIGDTVASIVDKKLTIPCLAEGSRGAESLNVGIAAAICMSELVKQKL